MTCPTQITSCVQRSKPIDSFPSDAGWIGSGTLCEENAANRLTLICIDLPNLRARANALSATSYTPLYANEAKQILSFALMVDGNLEEWYRTLPNEWKHRIIGVVSERIGEANLALAEKWPGEQHAYHDVPLASIMNDYRVCRIFCRRVIMACVDWLSVGGSGGSGGSSGSGGLAEANSWVDEDGVRERSVWVIQLMVDEISACVPFHMSYELQPLAKEMGQEQNGEPTLLFFATHTNARLHSCRGLWWILTCLATVCCCKCRDGTSGAARLALRSALRHRYKVWA